MKNHPLRSLRIMRNIHPRPEVRAHRNGRLGRPAEGWKGTSKKSLTAPRRSGKVLPRAERRQGGRRKAAGAIPAGGNLENRILDRRNHFLLSIQPVKPAQARRLCPVCPGFTISFSFICQDRGMDPIPLLFNGEFDPGSG